MDLELIDEDTIIENATKFSKEKFKTLLENLQDYYYNDENLVTDKTYDELIDIYEAKYGEYSVIGSVPKIDSVDLPYFLGSLKKVRKQSKIDLWSKSYPGPYIIEDKIDGLTLLFSNKGGKKSLYTRGDGTKGQDVSHILPYLSLPDIKKDVAVRGEIVLSKEAFRKIGAGFKNGRNLASGILRSKKHFNPAIAKELSFYAYRIMNRIASASTDILDLQSMGFLVPNPVSSPIISEEILRDYYENRKELAPYETDGLVLYHDEAIDHPDDGNPKHIIAFKPETEKAVTTVLKVVWKASKRKLLKPVVYYDPVMLSGAELQKASGYNAKFIINNSIGPGASILITRSGDVIPKIVKVITPAKKIDLPDVNKYGLYTWDKNEVEFVLEKNNSEVDIEKIKHFLDTLDIKNFGRKRIESIVGIGINTVDLLLKITPEQLLQIPGFGSSLVSQMIENLKEKITDIPLEKIMDASSIFPGIGEKRFGLILETYPDILTNSNNLEETSAKIRSIKGFDSLAEVISDKLPEFVEWLNKNREITLKDATHIGDSMAGIVVVFSGFRDKELEEKVKQLGGKVSTSISKNTSVLVLKDMSESSMKGKALEAKEKGVTIISKKDFLSKYF